MTADGLLAQGAKIAAFAGIAAVAIAALAGLRATHLLAYGVPIAWGLIAVWAAETTAKPDVANVALAAAGLVALYAAWPFARRRTT